MEKPLSLIKLSLINSRFQGRQHTFHAAVSAFSCGGNHQSRTEASNSAFSLEKFVRTIASADLPLRTKA